MKAFLKRLPFKKKILSSYFLFIAVSCVLIVIYCMKSMESDRDQSYSYMYQLSEQLSMNTDVIVSNMDRVRFLHLIDDNIKRIIRQSMEEKSRTEVLEDNEYIKQALNHMTNMNQYVLRATIVNEYGDVYSNVQTNAETYLEKMEAIDQNQNWDDKNKIYYSGVYREQITLIPFELVTSISKIYDIDRDSYVGTLYIDLNFSQIRKMLDESMENRKTGTKILIFDNNHQVIYDSEGEASAFWDQVTAEEKQDIREFLSQEEPEDRVLSIKQEECVVAAVRNQTTGWRILTWNTLADIHASGWRNMFSILLAMVVLLGVTILLVVYIADQISHPVTVLTEAMGKVDQGKVNLIDEEKYYWQDEMGQLLRSYNKMGRRINDSIEKIYIYQLNQKQTELKMLQFQINPHFLYNTLNTISSIADLEDIEEIVKIADNLSAMFQYNIKGDDIVPVGREIQHVKNYLEIQAIRFPGKYDFSYEISPEAEKKKMLKFLIQPLVENSLQHAFGKMKKINRIRLRAVIDQEENLQFSILDNGVGMDSIQAERLNRELSQTDTRTLVNHVDKGIGLRNVNARIKNFYGKDYGIQINSEAGKYTEIIIRIRAMGGCANEGEQDENLNRR